MIMMPGSGAGVRDGGAGGDGAPVQLPLRPGPGLVPQTDPSVKLYNHREGPYYGLLLVLVC